MRSHPQNITVKLCESCQDIALLLRHVILSPLDHLGHIHSHLLSADMDEIFHWNWCTYSEGSGASPSYETKKGLRRPLLANSLLLSPPFSFFSHSFEKTPEIWFALSTSYCFHHLPFGVFFHSICCMYVFICVSSTRCNLMLNHMISTR